MNAVSSNSVFQDLCIMAGQMTSGKTDFRIDKEHYKLSIEDVLARGVRIEVVQTSNADNTWSVVIGVLRGIRCLFRDDCTVLFAYLPERLEGS